MPNCVTITLLGALNMPPLSTPKHNIVDDHFVLHVEKDAIFEDLRALSLLEEESDTEVGKYCTVPFCEPV
ncbi:hypothetical protein K2173_003265 [Erythroxylum novogranatense]|uniref:Uncharacterized protein n=1 Tax=Erythroxylum novogranatense TaxID=1862640 RepID=A0AAV8SWY4_9ROSI|nr:hypothetical protein K2173_003204 [Erythroxylum novogranatense]KAJ8759027.1 hypothetical protein K2173_003265 [Erythroxylum novogranatense]